MPTWNKEYWETLVDQFNNTKENLSDRVNEVTDGRVTPALDDIKIGSGRNMSAASLFFDIRKFTSRTNSSNIDKLKETLYMLNCVIPMVMKIIYDNNGYIEKNTGDGIMAIIGSDNDDKQAANDALNAATTIFYTLKKLINPHLISEGIEKVDARIGIDLGKLLITRIGLPTGTSKHKRNFLTVVGPTANIACKIQNLAETNQIWVGDQIMKNAEDWRKQYFVDKTPNDWTWKYTPSNNKYKIWKYNAVRTEIK